MSEQQSPSPAPPATHEAPATVDPRQFTSFGQFYPYYLREHSNRNCRRLHFVGSSIALVCLIAVVITGHAVWLVMALIAGYGLAWIGHFVFEKNRPASFQRPLYSFRGDWVMWRDMLRGKIPF